MLLYLPAQYRGWPNILSLCIRVWSLYFITIVDEVPIRDYQPMCPLGWKDRCILFSRAIWEGDLPPSSSATTDILNLIFGIILILAVLAALVYCSIITFPHQ